MGFLNLHSPKKFKLISKLIPVALVLFVIGFGFGAWVMQFVINLYSQTALDFNVSNIWDISRFFSQTIIMGICLGLLFELPVVITLLIELKVVKKTGNLQKQTLCLCGYCPSCRFSPPNDVISLSILTVVPLFLFELALLLNKAII